MNSSVDPLLQFKPSEKLKEFIINSITVNDTDIPEGIKKYRLSVIQKDEEEVHLCLADIKWLQDQFVINHDSDRPNSFHDLMIGCDVKLPQPKIEPRSQELEARIQRLKAEQATRDYKAMTKNVDSVRAHEPEETIAYQLKQINKQLIAVAQFVFSVLAGFAFGFLGIELIVGNLDFGFRLLLGVMFALIIALAEIYFLAKKLSEDLPPTQTTTSQYVYPTTSKPHQE
ncbi:transmembrane protein 199 [Periplaneta americana]|uniref:transmembrane protein 199 n=1 Tax=Periplaneta americana TaxID=6978 RepID=UPI0037E71B89